MLYQPTFLFILHIISSSHHFSSLACSLSVCLSNWQCAENKKDALATGTVPFMQQNLHVTQFSSCQRQDRCPINSSPKSSWIFYHRYSTCKTLNWGKSFLFLYCHPTHQTKFGSISARTQSTFISMTQFPFTVTLALVNISLYRFLKPRDWCNKLFVILPVITKIIVGLWYELMLYSYWELCHSYNHFTSTLATFVHLLYSHNHYQDNNIYCTFILTEFIHPLLSLLNAFVYPWYM